MARHRIGIRQDHYLSMREIPNRARNWIVYIIVSQEIEGTLNESELSLELFAKMDKLST